VPSSYPHHSTPLVARLRLAVLPHLGPRHVAPNCDRLRHPCKHDHRQGERQDRIVMASLLCLRLAADVDAERKQLLLRSRIVDEDRGKWVGKMGKMGENGENGSA